MSFTRIVLSSSLVLLAASPVAAENVGPIYGTLVSSCSFGSCSSATGGADGMCALSTGGAQSLTITGFDFGLPPNTGTIDGFLVEPRIIDSGCQGSIQLLKDGVPVGTSRPLPSYFAATCDLAQYFSFGNSGDLFGSTWTPADLADPDFGVLVSNEGCAGVGIDTVRMSVHFTIGSQVCGDGYRTGTETCDDGNAVDDLSCPANCMTAPLTQQQQACVNTINGGLAKTVKAAGKALKKCHSGFLKGGADLATCYDSAETVAKIAVASSKVETAANKACTGELPAFAYTSAGDVGLYSTLLAELLYSDLVASYPGDYANDKAAASCQAAAVKAKQGVTNGAISRFNKCKKAVLAGSDGDPADWSDDLLGCLPTRGEGLELGILAALDKKCSGQMLDDVLSGTCSPSASNQERADCLARRAYCFACVGLRLQDDVAFDCDMLDNGSDDSSCGS